MFIRNENDILKEVLEEHFKFCDHIFILDGTIDNLKISEEICRSFNNISYFKDIDLPPNYPRPTRDGCRQFLLEKIRDKFGAHGWIAVLHGDEIFIDNPKEIISKYHGIFDALTFDSMLYFVHKEQYPFKLDKKINFQEQIIWHSGPGWPEARLYKNKNGSNYKNINMQGKVIPENLGINWKTPFKIKHYSLRNPDQQLNRARDRAQITKWSGGFYEKALQNKYYLDENDFGARWYRWISKKKVLPRAGDPFIRRIFEDLLDHYSNRKIRN